MSTDISVRDERIAQWWFQDMLGHQGRLPKGNFALVYMKTLMDAAAADGVLDKREKDWVLGFASTVGLHEDLIKQLETYQPGTSSEANEIFQNVNMDYVKTSRFGLIFYALQAASADGELHARELEAIQSYAKKLNISDAKLQELRTLAEEENIMRKKRAASLYPDGLDTAMVTYEQKFS